MPDRQVSAAEGIEGGLVEDLGYQTHVFEDHDLRALADRNPRRLLAPVLQRIEAEVGELGDLLVRRPDAEDATCILGSPIVWIQVVVQQTITLCHYFIVSG